MDAEREKKEIDHILDMAANIARFLGKHESNKLIFTYGIGGLFISVNDEERGGRVIIMHRMRPVCSNLIPEMPIYDPGAWVELIKYINFNLRIAKTPKDIQKFKPNPDYEIGPMVEV